MTHWVFHRFIDSSQETVFSGAKGVETASESLESEVNDAVMNEFLSRCILDYAGFAGEIGIQVDMLRELRFKWACEKLEDSEFYESLARMHKDAMEREVESKIHEASGNNTKGEDSDQVVS
ncbi:hypothetical protein R6Q57_016482 [Mikania cordata]